MIGARRLAALALAAAAAAFATFVPSLGSGFVSWDDPDVVLRNEHLRAFTADSVRWMFTTTLSGHWSPLRWVSHAIDWHAGGASPFAHHLSSVLLHALSTALVVVLAARVFALSKAEWATDARATSFAGLAAGLFYGLHPLRVEPVAWISARTDTLATPLALLSLVGYLDYARRAPWRRRAAVLAAISFVLSLLAKPMAVTLPAIALLLDAWPLARLRTEPRRALVEKLPFFGISGVFALAAHWAKADSGAILARDDVPLAFSVMNAFHSIAFYAWKTLWPAVLVPLYPIVRPEARAFSFPFVAALAAVVLVTVALVAGRRRVPGLATAWFAFVVALAPVLGFVQAGQQAAADRYTYLPGVALALVAGAGAGLLFSRRGVARVSAIATLAIVVVALGARSWAQQAVWRDSLHLWKHVVTIHPDESVIAHTNLANAYREAHWFDDAIREYRRASAIPPSHPYTEDALGTLLLERGDVDGAIAALERAVGLDPTFAAARYDLWFAYDRKGLADAALATAAVAVRLDPRDARSQLVLAVSLERASRSDEAESHFAQALALDRAGVELLGVIGAQALAAGRLDDAAQAFARGARLEPGSPRFAEGLADVAQRRAQGLAR